MTLAIPGVRELVGKGVYVGLPRHLPRPVRDRHAVVVGEPGPCTAVASRLRDAGWRVTIVRSGTELVCAAGIAYLEAVLLRRVDSGRIDAFNASALFVMRREQSPFT